MIECEEWEDYEEPKNDCIRVIESFIHYVEETEDSFCCDETVQKFTKKLKAWKRLQDKGFRFILDEETEMPMFIYSGVNGEKCITNAEESKQCRSDIKLLFGGEE